MLVLSRKKKESVVIDGDIRVFVIEIKGDSVRLGIEAAKSVPVHRHEVFERLEAEAARALTGGCQLAISQMAQTQTAHSQPASACLASF